MTATAEAVRVRGLVKSYGDRRAVDGLDLDIHRGECVAVLGPNGAGKTTTVEVLEGFRSRDGGEVRVLGADPQEAGRAWRARIGIVLQGSADVPELTVSELVRHYAGYYPRPRRADEVISAVGLDGQRDQRARALSGGQRRRLDVALGIVGRPELLFLDEPTTGFDPEARRAFWELVRSLRSDGTTVLLTTHYLDEAAQLADRVAVVAAGTLLEVASPERLGASLDRGVSVTWRDGDVPRSETTSRPAEVLRRLLAAHDGEVPELEVRRPTLEDVYLALVERGTRSTAPRTGPRS